MNVVFDDKCFPAEVQKAKKGPCCFNITEENSPGIVTSSCRSGSVITEVSEIESLDSGRLVDNAYSNQNLSQSVHVKL
jgi:hypothetical protein